MASFQGYSTNSMGELFRVSMPFVSTNDDISKYFLLSGAQKEIEKKKRRR